MSKLKSVLFSELDNNEKYSKFNEENMSENLHFLVSAIYSINGEEHKLESLVGDKKSIDINMILESINKEKEIISSNITKACFYFKSLDNNMFILYISSNKKINYPQFRSLAKQYCKYQENEKKISSDNILNSIINKILNFKDTFFLSKEIYDKEILKEEQLVDYLKNKNLKFDDDKKAIEYFKHTSYFVFKEYSNIFLDNKKYKNGCEFSQIAERIDLSNQLSICLFSVIALIENSISINFAKLLSENSPTEYLNYKWINNKAEAKSINNGVFKRAKDLFFNDSKLRDVSSDFIEKYNLSSIPIIHLIEYVTLGDLVILIDYSEDTIVSKLSKIYGLDICEFKLSIKLIKELRNKLAHGNKVIDKMFPGFTEEYSLSNILDKIEKIFLNINTHNNFKSEEKNLNRAKEILEKLKEVK